MTDNTEPTGLPEIQAPLLLAAGHASNDAALRSRIESLRVYSGGYYVRRDEVLALIDASHKVGSDAAALGIDLAALCAKVERMTVRIEPLGGQRTRYVQLDNVLALIEQADTSPKGGSDAEPMFYIQDTRSFVGNCPMWWAPNGAGYVTRLDEAGRFTEQEAIEQNLSRDTDVPWPCAEIDKIARLTVDHQHMRPRRERLVELAAAFTARQSMVSRRDRLNDRPTISVPADDSKVVPLAALRADEAPAEVIEHGFNHRREEPGVAVAANVHAANVQPVAGDNLNADSSQGVE